MKKLLGGVTAPPQCESHCGGALGQCSDSQECKSSTCTDKNGTITVYVCMAGGAL